MSTEAIGWNQMTTALIWILQIGMLFRTAFFPSVGYRSRWLFQRGSPCFSMVKPYSLPPLLRTGFGEGPAAERRRDALLTSQILQQGVGNTTAFCNQWSVFPENQSQKAHGLPSQWSQGAMSSSISTERQTDHRLLTLPGLCPANRKATCFRF